MATRKLNIFSNLVPIHRSLLICPPFVFSCINKFEEMDNSVFSTKTLDDLSQFTNREDYLRERIPFGTKNPKKWKQSLLRSFDSLKTYAAQSSCFDQLFKKILDAFFLIQNVMGREINDLVARVFAIFVNRYSDIRGFREDNDDILKKKWAEFIDISEKLNPIHLSKLIDSAPEVKVEHECQNVWNVHFGSFCYRVCTSFCWFPFVINFSWFLLSFSLFRNDKSAIDEMVHWAEVYSKNIL